MAFILRCEGILNKKTSFRYSETFYLFFRSKFLVKSNSEAAQVDNVKWADKLCENKTMLLVLMQTSKPIYTLLKFLTFEAKTKLEHFVFDQISCELL